MYFPKSQIQTGFFSNNDLVIVDTEVPYIGPYFKTSNGISYTGKEPNDGPNQQLILPSKLNTTSNSTNSTGDTILDPRFNRPNIVYSILTDQTKNNIPYSPISYFPILTQDDKENGEFTRYFAKKSNQNIYTEISATNYSLSGESALYLNFELQWVISGKKENVRQINAKQIGFVEKNLQIDGLGGFLRFNYLQFYQGGVNLPNDFHIMPDGSIMEGKSHEEYLKNLTPVINIQTSSSISSPPSNNINRGGY